MHKHGKIVFDAVWRAQRMAQGLLKQKQGRSEADGMHKVRADAKLRTKIKRHNKKQEEIPPNQAHAPENGCISRANTP